MGNCLPTDEEKTDHELKSTSFTHIAVMPRWSGDCNDDWYPWIFEQIKQNYKNVSIIKMELKPKKSSPKINECIDSIKRSIENVDDISLANTLFIGHSTGCSAILRYIHSINDKNIKIGGVLLVAAWFTIDEPWNEIIPWQEYKSFDFGKVESSVLSAINIIISDNDQYTKNYNETRKLFQQRLNANVVIAQNRNHFNANKEIQVWNLLCKILDNDK